MTTEKNMTQIFFTKDDTKKDDNLFIEIYNKIIKRQSRTLKNYAREHWKDLTNWDIESIEARATRQIEIATELHAQWRVSEYSVKFWSQTLATARNYLKQKSKIFAWEGNEKGKIMVVSGDMIEDDLQDDDALVQVIELAEMNMLQTIIQNVISWEDYIFVIDFLNKKVLANWTNRKKYKRILDEARTRTKHIKLTDEEKEEQKKTQQRAIPVSSSRKQITKATNMKQESKELFIYKKRVREYNKNSIDLVSLAIAIKKWEYTTQR